MAAGTGRASFSTAPSGTRYSRAVHSTSRSSGPGSGGQSGSRATGRNRARGAAAAVARCQTTPHSRRGPNGTSTGIPGRGSRSNGHR